ncbi:MAG: site-specific recombinase [Candidatus Scalindua rubra]|uniref:Site-specific recombinase n=1 Tax=Candidatus Scalindua rubra TaxID=1872076 RepID=A0A1E3X5B2_9BACT|nr:MAG: site-specific recombinase [Candidatus Scalindua rubra]
MKKKRESEFLTGEEIKAILRVPDRRSLRGKRDYALLLLMLSTGLRKAEVCGLKQQDVTTYRNQPVVDVTGKGGRHRRVALNGDVVEAVNDYQRSLNRMQDLSTKCPNNNAQEKHLFYTLGERGNCEMEPLTHKAVDCLLRRVKKAALINKRITPHSTRHTFATALLDKGVDLKTVQELMGHSHIRTTERYLHTTDEKKMDAVSRLQFI